MELQVELGANERWLCRTAYFARRAYVHQVLWWRSTLQYFWHLSCREPCMHAEPDCLSVACSHIRVSWSRRRSGAPGSGGGARRATRRGFFPHWGGPGILPRVCVDRKKTPPPFSLGVRRPPGVAGGRAVAECQPAN
jgi:hypothetical protein